MNKTTRKLEQSRPSLAQPPRKVDTCPENMGLVVILAGAVS